MAAPPFETYTASVWSSHVSVAFFFVLFSLEKSYLKTETRRKVNKVFQPLKPVWCSRPIALFVMKHDFHHRKQNRIAQAENQSLQNRDEFDQLYLGTKEMASIIPMELSILVGHHSEKRDRIYSSQIDNTMGRSAWLKFQ